jgi:hypothetical protein
MAISPYERAIEKLNDSERTTYPRMIALKNIIKCIEENHWPIEKRIAFLRIFHPSRAHPPQDHLPSHVMIPPEVVCYGLYKAIANSHLIKGRPKEPHPTSSSAPPSLFQSTHEHQPTRTAPQPI